MRSQLVTALLAFAVIFVGCAAAQAQSTGAGGKSGALGETPSQMLSEAESMVSFMDKSSTSVASILQAAQNEGDPDKISCVRDNLTAIKGLRKMFQSSLTALRQAAAGNNTNSARTQLVKIRIAKARVGDATDSARACGGSTVDERATADGQAVVDGQVDSDVPSLAPQSGVQSFDVLLDRPPAASDTF